MHLFLRQVFIQWVGTFLRENKHPHEGLKQALIEIEKEYRTRKQIREEDQVESYSEPDEFTRGTRKLVDFFKAFFIVFVLLFTLKGFRSGNQFEIVEYYGLSRLTGRVKMFTGVAFFVLAAVGLSQLVPYEELAVVYVGLAFTAYPFMVALGLLIKIPEDIAAIAKLKPQKTPLSLGQLAFLSNQRTSTEYLMEFNFYEAVFDQSLNLIISSHEHMHREIIEFHVQKGKTKSNQGPDLALFLEQLTSEPIKLSAYLKMVYGATGRFKAYRKDILIKPLVAAGYINKWGWVFNLFILTKKGKAIRSKIKQKVVQQDKLINQGLNRPETLSEILPKLNKFCLLATDFESRMTELHNIVVDMDMTHYAMQQPTGILFDYRLSLRTFNSNLKEAYFYRLPWSWNDNDANEGYWYT